MRFFLVCCAIIFWPLLAQSQQRMFEICGVVIEEGSDKVVRNAHVSIQSTKCETRTQDDGTFVLRCSESIPHDNITVVVSSPYYEVPNQTRVSPTTRINKVVVRPRQSKLYVELIDSSGVTIRDGKVMIDGRAMALGNDGRFSMNVSMTREEFFISYDAAGFLPNMIHEKRGQKIIKISMKRAPNRTIRAPKVDSVTVVNNRGRDSRMIQSFFDSACCSNCGGNCRPELKQLFDRLAEYYSPENWYDDPINPLQRDFNKIITGLVAGIQRYECKDDIVLTLDILRWIHSNENARRSHSDSAHVTDLVATELQAVLKQMRLTLGVLLMEGVKKTYLTKSYRPLPVMYPFFGNKEFTNYRNRAKIFEFVIAVSSQETLASNVYQAQSELLELGKIKLPVKKIRRKRSWQFRTDGEHLIVNYFRSRRKALKVASAESPIQCNILKTESEIFKAMRDKVDLLRFRIDSYISILDSYGIEPKFDGYKDSLLGVSKYREFLKLMPCDLMSDSEIVCTEFQPFTWKTFQPVEN